MPLLTSAARSSCRDGYGNAKHHGKPVFPKMQKTRMNAGFLALTGLVPAGFVQIPFIAMLKLLFNLIGILQSNKPANGGWDCIR